MGASRAAALLLVALIVCQTASAAAGALVAGQLPWEAAVGAPFAWEGLESDLDALLRVQASGASAGVGCQGRVETAD